MNKIVYAAACVLLLSGTLAQAQSSQGKGGAAVTGDTADPAKGIGAPGSSVTETLPAAGSSGTVVVPDTAGNFATVPNPATGAPVPNAAISRPPGDATTPAGR